MERAISAVFCPSRITRLLLVGELVEAATPPSHPISIVPRGRTARSINGVVAIASCAGSFFCSTSELETGSCSWRCDLRTA